MHTAFARWWENASVPVRTVVAFVGILAGLLVPVVILTLFLNTFRSAGLILVLALAICGIGWKAYTIAVEKQ